MIMNMIMILNMIMIMNMIMNIIIMRFWKFVIWQLLNWTLFLQFHNLVTIPCTKM